MRTSRSRLCMKCTVQIVAAEARTAAPRVIFAARDIRTQFTRRWQWCTLTSQCSR